MKVLIKNKKWETSFENIKLICEVTGYKRNFNIKFCYNGNEISLKSNDLDKTFRYLENTFNSIKVEDIPEENRIYS